MAFSQIMMQQLLNPPRDFKHQILMILHANGRAMTAAELRDALGSVNMQNISDTIQQHLKLKKLVTIEKKVRIKGTPNLVAFWKLTPLGEQMVKGLAAQ